MAFDFDSSIAAYQEWVEELKSPREIWLSDPVAGGFDLGTASIDGMWTLAVRSPVGMTPLQGASKGVRLSSACSLARLRAQVEVTDPQP